MSLSVSSSSATGASSSTTLTTIPNDGTMSTANVASSGPSNSSLTSSSTSTNTTSPPPGPGHSSNSQPSTLMPSPSIKAPSITNPSDPSRDHDRTLTSTTTLVVTMRIPLGTTTSGTVEWSTMVQSGLTVQLVLPSDFNLSNTHGSNNNSSTIGIIFGSISLALLFLAGMFVILRRHFKKKYSQDLLARFQNSVRQAGAGPYAAQAGISHLHQEDLESSEEFSEETAVMSPIMEYREGRRSPVEVVPQLYTDGSSVLTASSFITVSSVPVPFYERIKEARRAGIRKYTM